MSFIKRAKTRLIRKFFKNYKVYYAEELRPGRLFKISFATGIPLKDLITASITSQFFDYPDGLVAIERRKDGAIFLFDVVYIDHDIQIAEMEDYLKEN